MTAHISAISYASTMARDFVSVSVPSGADPADFSVAIYQSGGSLARIVKLEELSSSTDDGDVYRIDRDDHKFGQINDKSALALVGEDGAVLQFLSFNGNVVTAINGPATGEVSVDVGNAEVEEILETSDGGNSYQAYPAPDPDAVPCFAPDTLIATPDGPVVVSSLRSGDRVCIQGSSTDTVRLVRRAFQQKFDEGQWPVLIPAHAFGWGRPFADLVLSPQHRVLIGSHRQATSLVDRQCLVPAKTLVGHAGIRWMRGRKSQAWVHFALTRHQIVRANGCLTESLLLGEMVLQGLSKSERDKLRSLFSSPPSLSGLNGPPVLPLVRPGAVTAIKQAGPA